MTDSNLESRVLLERESDTAAMAARYEAPGGVNHRAAAMKKSVGGGVEWRVPWLMGGGLELGVLLHPPLQ